MFTPAELEKIPIEVQRIVINLSKRIMLDVADRINMIGSISRTADYEIYRLSQIGLSSETIRKAIQEALKLSNAEIDRIYNEVIQEGYASDESLYNAVGKPFTSYAENLPLQQLIDSVRSQTKLEMENITQTMGFAINMGGKTVFTPMAQYYQRTMDSAMMNIVSGTFDYNSTIKKAINEMTKSGVRTIDYESGWSNRIEVATRRAIMTGVNQVTNKINEQNAYELGTDYFEVSWHATARPEHQKWQGRVYSRKELVDVCRLGTVTGLLGANCYHSYYPFIPGVSVRQWTDKQLDEMNAKENEPRKYKDKEYTTYEATQKQRQLETMMRKQRQDIDLLKHANVNADDIQAAQIKYQATMATYRKFSEAMELPQQRERIYMDGLGRVG